AKDGSVPIPVRLASCSLMTLRNPSARIFASVVHCCPLWPTYWRVSSQMGHVRGSSSPVANCTPHVTQIQASIRCLLLIHFSLSLLFYHRSGALQHISSQTVNFGM